MTDRGFEPAECTIGTSFQSAGSRAPREDIVTKERSGAFSLEQLNRKRGFQPTDDTHRRAQHAVIRARRDRCVRGNLLEYAAQTSALVRAGRKDPSRPSHDACLHERDSAHHARISHEKFCFVIVGSFEHEVVSAHE